MRDPGHERLIGRTIAGKFVVEELLGAGAMGSVYRARQVALEKTVAIKVLHGEHAHDATFAARFHREAKAASRLNHPNSMQVIDFGAEPDGLLYIAMEYLDGRSLHRVLREQWPLSSARIADILMQTLAALAVAHDMGVVHRDLKPENIMVLGSTDDDGRPKDLVKVCDFGIAKITDSRAYRANGDRESNGPVTTAGFLVGTPEYMSPEQGRGAKLDARSDLYSVGVVLFEMLTGRVPFEAENAIGVVLRHITETPRRPSDLVPSVDLRLEAICLRALCKDPAERHGSAREMRAEMRPVAMAPPAIPAAPATSTPELATLTPPIAPTLQMQAAPFPGDTAPKPTLLGTTTTIPGSPARRALVLASAVLVGGALLATTALMMARSHVRRPAAVTGRANATEPARATIAPMPQLASAEIDSTRSEPSATVAAESRTSIPHGRTSPAQWTGARAAVTPTPPATTTSALALAPLPAQSAPLALTASASPPPTPTQAPPTEAPDPTFDPERAYVEVGLVNAQGAREPSVRAAMRTIGLARCYRSALRARGARATGTATLNLSFDETGFARSAIVTGAEFLPGLARCLQGAGTGVHIPRASVDPSGATAEVVLAFKAP